MSFIKRAQEAAEAAKAKVEEAAQVASRTANDPSTAEKINRGIGMARRGVNTVVERIDPGTLAELIVKATALQEMTNKSLRQKGSPYRIGEISISASIPPGVSFAISRIDDMEEELVGEVRSSAELVDAAAADGDVVLALDGATVDEATATAIAEAVATPGAMPPSSVSRNE